MWIRVLFFSDLLLAAVRRLRPLGGATECGAIVAEVTGGIHLVLHAITQRRHWSKSITRRWAKFAYTLTVGKTTFECHASLERQVESQLKIFAPLTHNTNSTSVMHSGFFSPPGFQICQCWLYSMFSSVWKQDSCSSQLKDRDVCVWVNKVFTERNPLNWASRSASLTSLNRSAKNSSWYCICWFDYWRFNKETG